MHDRTYPRQVRTRRQRIGHEIARDELDTLVETGRSQPPPRHRDHVRQVKKRRLGRGERTKKSNGPGARRPAKVQQVPELQRLHGPDDFVGVRRGDIMHRPDERLLRAFRKTYFPREERP